MRQASVSLTGERALRAVQPVRADVASGLLGSAGSSVGSGTGAREMQM